MQALITDLLAFSRLNTRGKEFKPVDLNDVAKQAVGNVQASIEESKAKVKIGDLPKVSGDRTQLVQLVQNLLSNALKFRRPDVQPSIELSAKRDGATWLVSVSDNGIGIEPEYREKVFVIFQRLHGRDQYPGTGIGLSICKKIVERHQGRIWIEDREGDGTTFTFSLPAEGST
jgi:light-regulated signal transduction histidine kinase (bacteriophytochrome)